jgi:hypothetical protein
VGTNDGGTAEYTDLNRIFDLTQTQLESMIGDSGTIIPDHLTRPKHWGTLAGHLNGQRVGADPPLSNLPIASTVTPVVDVGWREGTLSATFHLSALEPVPRGFHPPAPTGSMEMLASLGQLAKQIATSIRANSKFNIAAITGDVATIFEAIEAEIQKTRRHGFDLCDRSKHQSSRNHRPRQSRSACRHGPRVDGCLS